MFTLTLSLNDIKRLIMKDFGYKPEDLVNVNVSLIKEFGTTYVKIVDRNVAVGPEEGQPEEALQSE